MAVIVRSVPKFRKATSSRSTVLLTSPIKTSLNFQSAFDHLLHKLGKCSIYKIRTSKSAAIFSIERKPTGPIHTKASLLRFFHILKIRFVRRMYQTESTCLYKRVIQDTLCCSASVFRKRCISAYLAMRPLWSQ